MPDHEKTMQDYLEYLFPKKKFKKKYYDIFYALFVKGYDEGYCDRVMQEEDERKQHIQKEIEKLKKELG